MPSLLVTIFILQLVIYLINIVGAATINNLLWILYSRLPLQSSKIAKEQIRLRREVVRLKREMNATSSQDEFAKWAKLRRAHDKAVDEHDKKAAAVNASRASFDTTVTVTRWITTNGFRLFLQFYHTKTPIYQFPRGWVPWYVEWILAFPRAPSGSVSIQVWGAACGIAIALFGEILTFVLASTGSLKTETNGNQPMKMAASGGEKGGKKEL